MMFLLFFADMSENWLHGMGLYMFEVYDWVLDQRISDCRSMAFWALGLCIPSWLVKETRGE